MPAPRNQLSRAGDEPFSVPAQGDTRGGQWRPYQAYVRPLRPYKWRGKGLEALRAELDALWAADQSQGIRQRELRNVTGGAGLAKLRDALFPDQGNYRQD